MSALIPNRWAHEVGVAMSYAGAYCTLRAAPDGSRNVTFDAVFYLVMAVVLLAGGRRLLRRERW